MKNDEGLSFLFGVFIWRFDVVGVYR